MQVGTGKSILNGIAIGKLKIYKKKDTVISTAQVADTAAEEARFEEARAKAIDQQTALYEKALAEAGEDIAEVFNIHAMMLDDDDFVDAIKEIINGQHMCAEYAVKKAGDNQAAVFAAMDDPYLQARSADVIDIAQAMLDILQGVDNATLQGTEPSILVAEDLAPSETVRMDKSLLLGFITREGSSNSHTAILARSMNIPALIQCKEIQEDWDGKMAVVDGYNACVYVDPTPDLLESLKKRQQEDQKKLALLAELKGKPNTTLDGKTVQVFANIGGMSDVGAVQQNDAGGVGLFRTEFVYLNCTDYPTEEYQFEAYKQVLESLAPKKVVVRTCDIGADKTVDYMKLDHDPEKIYHKLALYRSYGENARKIRRFQPKRRKVKERLSVCFLPRPRQKLLPCRRHGQTPGGKLRQPELERFRSPGGKCRPEGDVRAVFRVPDHAAGRSHLQLHPLQQRISAGHVPQRPKPHPGDPGGGQRISGSLGVGSGQPPGSQQYAAEVPGHNAAHIPDLLPLEHVQHRLARRALRLAVIGIADHAALLQEVAPAVVPGVIVFLFHFLDAGPGLRLRPHLVEVGDEAGALFRKLALGVLIGDDVLRHANSFSPEKASHSSFFKA